MFFSIGKASKSHLIVKSQYSETANVVLINTKFNLTLEGVQHLWSYDWKSSLGKICKLTSYQLKQ